MNKFVLTLISVLSLTELSYAIPTGDELCVSLTAAEVSAIVGSNRSAIPTDEACTYQAEGRPDMRLIISNSASKDEFLKSAKALGATIEDPTAAELLYSMGFDTKNLKTSGAWFQINGQEVELEFDGGLESEKVKALIKAAH